MINRIISGGQTGVDRAALDAALELGVAVGGWCPRGRLAEDGPISNRYPLRETPSADYCQRTEFNVRDSDGTLVLYEGTPSGGTALTVELARQWNRPCLLVELSAPPSIEEVCGWIRENGIQTLNVAGPRASSGSQIYDRAFGFVCKLLGPRVQKQAGGF